MSSESAEHPQIMSNWKDTFKQDTKQRPAGSVSPAQVAAMIDYPGLSEDQADLQIDLTDDSYVGTETRSSEIANDAVSMQSGKSLWPMRLAGVGAGAAVVLGVVAAVSFVSGGQVEASLSTEVPSVTTPTAMCTVADGTNTAVRFATPNRVVVDASAPTIARASAYQWNLPGATGVTTLTPAQIGKLPKC